MNGHPPPSQPGKPYTNGHYETPLEISGVSLHRPAPVQKPTVFAPDLMLQGLAPLLYALHRFHLGGIPLARYLAGLWIIIALFAIVGLIPGRWITASVALLLFVGQIALNVRHRRQHYVHFEHAPAPPLQDRPLEPNEKLPVYATGLLNVEGRYQTYSALPGFYRTFATGEHAVLCLVQERRWLGLFTWPVEELGMWYAFVNPTEIEQLTWGTLHFGKVAQPALAVQYRLEIPPGPRRKKSEIRQELLYLATPEVGDARRMYVDLLNNLPPDKVVSRLSPATTTHA